jgi:hypothetical protein
VSFWNVIGLTKIGLEALRGSFASCHFQQKTFVADAIAQAKFVRDTISKKTRNKSEKNARKVS